MIDIIDKRIEEHNAANANSTRDGWSVQVQSFNQGDDDEWIGVGISRDVDGVRQRHAVRVLWGVDGMDTEQIIDAAWPSLMFSVECAA